jgi:hypothetical protein
LSFGIVLADEKTLRGRVVYSLIELISEVSGLADIFNLGVAAFFAFYTAQVQKAEVVEEMTSIVSSQKPRVRTKNLERDVLSEFTSRFRLRTNLWLTLTSGYCPNAWRTERQMKVL